MLKTLSHHQIDFKKWDQAVLNSAMPLVFAQSFYLNATCKEWSALVLNNYEAILPLTKGKKLNISYLYQPPFTPQLGVFGQADTSTQKQLLEEAKRLYKYIDIELNASVQLPDLKLPEKQTFVIDYSKAFSFNENTRRNIAKAKKQGVTVKAVTDSSDILSLCRKVLIPWLRSEIGISKAHGDIFLQLVQNALTEGFLHVLAAYDKEGDLLSLGYFISNGKHAVYLKGMSLNKKDNSGSMHLLMAEAIEYYRDKAGFFDFGGGNQKGMANFYKGLGGTALTYHLLKVNNLRWPLNKLKK